MCIRDSTSLAPESISGEKERGTLTTLLVTPVHRSEIAIGKILALSILALLSGLSSFTGTALSLPKLMAMSGDDVGVNVNVYHVQDYALLLMIVLCSVLLIISLISVVSAYAKMCIRDRYISAGNGSFFNMVWFYNGIKFCGKKVGNYGGSHLAAGYEPRRDTA